LISYGDRRYPLRDALDLQRREWAWSGRWTRKIDRILYKDGYHRWDLWGLRKPREVVGFDAHSKFLLDPDLFRAIHATDWEVDERRPILVNFIGSRDPSKRERILDSVAGFFADSEHGQQRGDPTKRTRWLAYTDAQPGALSAPEFIAALTESDFTLAPPGYSLVTHRPVEALLRGSIPVLHTSELDLYDLGLRDGENCIAVTEDRWPDAMSRIFSMEEAEIRRMRRQVRDMLPDKVAYAALARDIARRLGVSTP
jgi:hypothetical protein